MLEEDSLRSRAPQEWINLVEAQGNKVGLHTKDCILWKASHPNCKGCPSEVGCSKAVALMGISLQPIIYPPKDYDDFAKMQSAIQEKMDKVLNANTIEEIHAIRW